MLINHLIRTSKTFIIILSILLSASTIVYAENKDFNSPCFSMAVNYNLNLISKDEKSNSGFYRYVFSSSTNDSAEMQMRVIVSNKKPEPGQSIEDFQVAAIGAMSAMFIDSYKLSQYLDTPENKKVLSEKPYQLQIGNATFAGTTMYFGNINASFLVTRSNNMTYAFTLISNNSNAEIRTNNLTTLTRQLQSLKFQTCSQ